jgi:hypothetical protein
MENLRLDSPLLCYFLQCLHAEASAIETAFFKINQPICLNLISSVTIVELFQKLSLFLLRMGILLIVAAEILRVVLRRCF